MPWIGATVVVTKQSHGRKGQCGTVEGVLHGQKTPSGLRVTVRFDTYDPSMQSRPELFDYDDVLEYTYVF
jgi:hypothetical protein